MTRRRAKIALGISLTLSLVGGLLVLFQFVAETARVHVVAYFANSNGIFPGDLKNGWIPPGRPEGGLRPLGGRRTQ